MARPLGPELSAARIAYIRRRTEDGSTLANVAAELGISPITLSRFILRRCPELRRHKGWRDARTLTERENHERKAEIYKLMEDPQCSIRHIAKHFGMSNPAVFYYVRRHMPDALAEFRDRKYRNRSLDPKTVLGRLEAVKAGDAAGTPRYKVAESFGIKESTLSVFLKRYATHGVDDALQDYAVDDDEMFD
jgi:transposase-like protein